MKKIIALLLAFVMVFSLGTVAFATDETTAPETSTTEPAEGETTAGELDWILDLPFWTVGPALKFAKIALKLVKVYVKLAIIFGIIDKDEITEQIDGMIQDAMNNSNAQEETTAVPTTDVPTEEPAPEAA